MFKELKETIPKELKISKKLSLPNREYTKKNVFHLKVSIQVLFLQKKEPNINSGVKKYNN